MLPSIQSVLWHGWSNQIQNEESQGLPFHYAKLAWEAQHQSSKSRHHNRQRMMIVLLPQILNPLIKTYNENVLQVFFFNFVAQCYSMKRTKNMATWKELKERICVNVFSVLTSLDKVMEHEQCQNDVQQRSNYWKLNNF